MPANTLSQSGWYAVSAARYTAAVLGQTGPETNRVAMYKPSGLRNEDCHDSPTLDEEPLQKAILTAINRTMSSPDDLIRQITSAMATEVSPLPGQLLSLAEIERRLNDLEIQFNTLLEQTAEQEDAADCLEHFQSITQEITALKEQRTQIKNLCENSSVSFQRTNMVASILQSTSPAISEWDETIIRQLVDTVKVLSPGKIIVYLYGGIEIEQIITE